MKSHEKPPASDVGASQGDNKRNIKHFTVWRDFSKPRCRIQDLHVILLLYDHLGMIPPDVNHHPQVSFNWFIIRYAPVWDDAKRPQHDWLMGWFICFDNLAVCYGKKQQLSIFNR